MTQAAPRRSWAAMRARKRKRDRGHPEWRGPGPLLRLTCVVAGGNTLIYLTTEYGDLPNWAISLVLVGGGIAISDLGFTLSRRWKVVHKDAGEGQAAVFGIVGTLYAVLVAFAIVVVWQDFSEAGSTTSNEANAIADLDRMSRTYPVPIRRQVQEASRTYVRLVINDEWPLMEQAGSSPRAYAALVELWNVYTDMAPRQRGQALHSESIQVLNTLDNNRRLRLQDAKDDVPATMWMLLYTGGVSTITLTYFFVSTRGEQVQRFRILLLAGVNYLSLFLISALSEPFNGALKVTPDVFVFVLQHLQQLEK